MVRIIVAFMFVAGLVGCSFDASEPPDGPGGDWDLGDQFDAQSNSGNNDSGTVQPGDGGPVSDMSAPSDMSTGTADSGGRDTGGTETDMGGSTTDAGGTDGGSSTDSGTDSGADMGSGTTLGMACATNTTCNSGEVCCPDLQGNGTCQLEADCVTGGFCAADMDCASNEECCNLSGINAGQVCLTTCVGQGGGGTVCTTNADCMGADVCCPNLTGTAECTPGNQCFSGGVCNTDADCQGAQQCCNLQIGKLCFNRCGL